MDINLLDLKLITNRLLDHLIETRGLVNVQVKASLYWTIPAEERYKVNDDPRQLEVGSIEDNWKLISSILDQNNQPVAYQLTELAPILEYLGELLGEQLARKGG